MPRIPLLALMVASALMARSQLAAAQEPTAEQLYEAGGAAFTRGDYATACPALRRSWEMSKGRGALYKLAQCEDAGRAGRLATSLALWVQVRAAFGDQRAIAQEAEGRITALEAAVARVTLRRASDTPADVRVTLDGRPVELDVPLPVDAGSHALTATAAGHQPLEREVRVADGETAPIVVQVGPATAATASTTPTPAPTTPPDEVAGDDGSGWTTAGLVAGGVGVAGLALFAISGLVISGAESDIDAACDEDRTGCGPEAAEAADRGEAWMVPNTIGFVTGVVGVGLGVTFLVVGAGDGGDEAAAGPTVRVGARLDGVEVRGRF